MKALFREPIVQFLIVGAVFYAFVSAYSYYGSPKRIVIDEGVIATIQQRYAQQSGAAPSSAQMRSLVQDYVEQEVLFREGQKMGLDQSDEVIRRRVVQKMDFLIEGAVAEPSETVLREYYAANAKRYMAPERVSFTHIYFSPSGDKPGAAARLRAENALKALAKGERITGDPFPDQRSFTSLDEGEVARVFGRSDFSASIMRAPERRWAGPFESGLGWHLSYVDAREAAHMKAFSDVRGNVLADWQYDERKAARRAALARMTEGYEIGGDAAQ